MNKMTPIPQNYKNSVDWILGAYKDADVTFPNGFQKDAIQNAIGASKTRKFENWRCDISVVRNLDGEFVVIEDSGTWGLTGENRPTEDVNKMMAEGASLPPEERLSRFTSMFNSGGNTTGGGLFGAGKSVYSVASNTYTYYFDSLRDDGKYVANVNEGGRVYSVAYEGEEAKSFILNNTGLDRKNTIGTRIIIVNPKQELVDSIVSGTIENFIKESWWRIIKRLPETSYISVNGKEVYFSDEIYTEHSNKQYELKGTDIVSINHKIKHFGFYIYENGENQWKGISYYRKGMKIGEIDVKDIPSDLVDKFWGYVEVDETWEEELTEIEDHVHFGVSKGAKRNKTYQDLKNYCNSKVQELLREWNYIKDKSHDDVKLNLELMQIATELQNLFDKLKIDDLGKGPRKESFEVRWQDVVYPIENTERVTSNDQIKFSVRIKSSFLIEKIFEYNLSIKSIKTGKIIAELEKGKIQVDANSYIKKNFIHTVNSDNSEQYAENRIILSVKAVGSRRKVEKELSYFYDIDRPVLLREMVALDLHECIFPREKSRRVNTDEVIKNVCYRIENKRNYTLNYKLRVSIHNASDKTCPKICDVASLNGVLKPFDEVITPHINDIVFIKDLFEQYLDSGILELRAKLLANEDDDEFEKGDRITDFKYKIFFNCDERNGKNDAFNIKSVDAPDKYQRSWCTPGLNREICLNIGHAAYQKFKDDPEVQHEYLKEQMLKQYVLLYMKEGKFDMFGMQDKDFLDLDPQEAVDQVMEKIENIYAEVWK